MSGETLLRIIAEEARKSPRRFADGEVVASRYGPGFERTFEFLVAHGFIDRAGPANVIPLSELGWAAVENGLAGGPARR